MGWEDAFENLKSDTKEGAFRTDGLEPRGHLVRQLAPADTDERLAAGRLEDRERKDRAAKAWWASQVFLDLLEREQERQREFRSELREIQDRDLFDHLGEGWKAATTAVGGGVALASLAGGEELSRGTRAALAVATGVAAAIAGYTTVKRRSKKEAGRIVAGIRESERAVTRGRREVGMVMRLLGAPT
jgi:hypothetical protein